MRTECTNCGKVLTNEAGERLENGNFDPTLPTKPSTDSVTYAWCDECYQGKEDE